MARILALILVAAMAIGGPAAAKPKPARQSAAHAKAKAAPKPKPRPTAKSKAKPKPSPDEAAASVRAPRASEAPPSLPLAGLLSANEAEARARLGPPDLARTEASGAMWTYRLPDCALFVFFKAAEGQPLRVSGAATGPRRRGQPPAGVDACIAQALAQAARGSS